MKYPLILNSFNSTPWAILPEKLAEMQAFLRLKAAGGAVDEDRIADMTDRRDERADSLLAAVQAVEPQAARRADGVVMAGRIAVLPVFGVLMQRVGMIDAMSGGISTEELGASLDSLVADKTVKGIVMVFDSPGGSVFGIQELGDRIRAAKDEKKVVGIADSLAASAAYWLIAQTSEVAVTPGGMMGSVGVLTAHIDVSKAEEMAGIKTTLVASSPEKVEQYPEIPLSEDARTDMQKTVSIYYDAFVGALSKGRNISRERVLKDFGNGRMFTSKEAVNRGMADRVATLDRVLRGMGGADTTTKAAAMTAEATETLAEIVENTAAYQRSGPTPQGAAARARALTV